MHPIAESIAVWTISAIAAVLLHDSVQRMVAGWMPVEPDAMPPPED